MNDSQKFKSREEAFKKVLNVIMGSRYSWWKEATVATSVHARNTMFIGYTRISLVIKADAKWVKKQWKTYHEYEPYPNDNIDLYDLIGYQLKEQIESDLKTVFMIVYGLNIEHLIVEADIQPTPLDIEESLEDKWNPKDGLKGYDYQHGYCHYFAYNIIDKIKKRFPTKNVNYYLLLASEVDTEDGAIINEYLIHAFIKIDDMLLDSNGFTTEEKAWRMAEEWEQRQKHLIPDYYETEIWDEESDEIPQKFFNNKFCNRSKVKKDLENFLSHPVVKRIFRDK